MQPGLPTRRVESWGLLSPTDGAPPGPCWVLTGRPWLIQTPPAMSQGPQLGSGRSAEGDTHPTCRTGSPQLRLSPLPALQGGGDTKSQHPDGLPPANQITRLASPVVAPDSGRSCPSTGGPRHPYLAPTPSARDGLWFSVASGKKEMGDTPSPNQRDTRLWGQGSVVELEQVQGGPGGQPLGEMAPPGLGAWRRKEGGGGDPPVHRGHDTRGGGLHGGEGVVCKERVGLRTQGDRSCWGGWGGRGAVHTWRALPRGRPLLLCPSPRRCTQKNRKKEINIKGGDGLWEVVGGT
jgi:hypothetical protein